MNLPFVAGAISTSLFAASVFPMLLKAFRTKDLASYSLGNIVTSNVANLIHSVYVFSLPLGPIWLLHSFYLVATALMLVWFLRFGRSAEAVTSSRAQAVRAVTIIRPIATRVPITRAVADGQEEAA